MSGWLMAPERLPSYFARDTEPVQARPARRSDEASGRVSISAKSALRLVKRVADAMERQGKGSVASW